MSDVVVAGIIGAGAAVVSSAVTGFITYKVSIKTEKLQSLKAKLIRALNDITSLYQLEAMYAEKVANLENSTTESVRRSFRDRLAEEGFDRPSKYAAPSYVRDELEKLER